MKLYIVKVNGIVTNFSAFESVTPTHARTIAAVAYLRKRHALVWVKQAKEDDKLNGETSFYQIVSVEV